MCVPYILNSLCILLWPDQEATVEEALQCLETAQCICSVSPSGVIQCHMIARKCTGIEIFLSSAANAYKEKCQSPHLLTFLRVGVPWLQRLRFQADRLSKLWDVNGSIGKSLGSWAIEVYATIFNVSKITRELSSKNLFYNGIHGIDHTNSMCKCFGCKSGERLSSVRMSLPTEIKPTKLHGSPTRWDVK